MTNYRVVAFDFIEKRQLFEREFKVRHFRQYKGNAIDINGGSTALFDLSSGHVLVAKCRNNEQFSRRKGILTALQKALKNKAYKELDSFKVDYIASAKFFDGEVHLTLCDTPKDFDYSKHYWWL